MTARPVITAGEAEHHTWCSTCQAPTRARVNLHDGEDGPLLGTIEICPGCGANHATPSVTVTPASPPGWWQRHKPAPPPRCDRDPCDKRSKTGHTVTVQGEHGRAEYRFCSGEHEREWAREHYVMLPGDEPFAQ